MVESIIAVFFILLLFLLLYQFADAMTAKIVLSHSAARAARARAVGFNDFMVRKTALSATIPVSGKRIIPTDAELGGLTGEAAFKYDLEYTGAIIDLGMQMGAGDALASVEIARIPRYLAAYDGAEARGVLDYELWDRTDVDVSDGGQTITARVRHSRPTIADFSDIEGGSLENGYGEVEVEGEYKIESHYPLYLDDAGL